MEVTGRLSVSLVPGMYLDINIPIVNQEEHLPNGMMPKTGTYTYNGVDKDLTTYRGFFVENDIVGHLENIEDSGQALLPKIRYVHDKPFPNKVYFLSTLNEMCVVDIIAIPIHDHSSITQGGPAYATYFSNYTNLLNNQNSQNS